MMDSKAARFILQASVDQETKGRVREFHAGTAFVYAKRLFDRLRPSRNFLGQDIVLRAPLEISDDYDRCISIPLPDGKATGRRGSLRKFTTDALPFQAVTHVITNAIFQSRSPNGRAYASAGDLYPVECLLVTLPGRVEGAPKSHIHQISHHTRSLVPYRAPDIEAVLSAALNDELRAEIGDVYFSGQPNFLIIYILDLDKCLARYQERGYRFALMEVGAVYQRFAEAAAAQNIGNLLWSTYGDDKLSRALKLRPHVALPALVQMFAPYGAGESAQ